MRKFLSEGYGWVTAGYLLVVMLGYVDYLTGDYSLLLFYLAPVSLVAWHGGRRGAVLVSLLSGLARYVSDYYSHSALTFKPWQPLEDTALIIAVASLVLVMKKLMTETRA
ncbi:DUF4118 domain-containing protein [Geomonas subterranea]|uniref:DUF4118 domain-containing protein n=1 Tax=Geomonas subterranea TaxID=2847989 RepID=A0ABX8LIH7_9BACT|nr:MULTISPECIES: DUF4118 domain-containing protein [Geomonas]QXE90464.1 DUF4118 domain-containing protein [Geomonas subterranea]QXM11460.1 DUF4118 domain-containing protein [Geomonas subterranea]